MGLYSSSGWAFESFPEFQWLSEREASGFDDPQEIQAEYSSDFLTYSPPIDQDAKLAQQRKIFDLSAGSLGSKEFFIKDHLKLHQYLIPNQVEFRFHYINEQDYETTVSAHVIELIYWMNRFGISVFGQASFEKSKDDAGLAFLYQFNKDHELRVWTAFADFSRNKRNNESDKFVDDQAPKAYGLVGRLTENDLFLQYSARVEDKVHWLFSDAGYEYRFSRYHLGLSGKWKFAKSQSLGLRSQYDRKFESRVSIKTVNRERLLTQIEYDFLRKLHLFRFGLAYFYREYDISDSSDVLFRHTLPYAWIRLTEKGDFAFRRAWWFGAEATYPEEAKPEYRSNVKYEMDFSEQGSLSFLFTFDLDDFGTGTTWEGGNAQFTLAF